MKPENKENVMKNLLPSNLTSLTKAAARILLGFALAAGTVNSLHAQGQITSGTVAGSGSGPYTYNLVFTDAPGATSPIGSVWYAWIPGFFYLPGVPTSASAPAGWTATVQGDSIQFVANAPADDIAAGQSLSGFSYQATFTPAQLAAAANSGRSDAYSGGLFSDSGNIFVVQAVPEPSGQILLLAGAAAGWLIRRCRFRTT
jgi:hypothetical protein